MIAEKCLTLQSLLRKEHQLIPPKSVATLRRSDLEATIGVAERGGESWPMRRH